MKSTAVPTEDGKGYMLNGVKLWTTNGVIAELVVIMARVPKSEGHRGGITAFVVEMESPGITVEHRNDFMGLRGHRERRHPVRRRLRAGREPDRQGGARAFASR